MKQITLQIEDSKFEAFKSFLETLNYVSITDNDTVPQWQQDEVSRRAKLIETGKMSTRNWEEAREDIFKN